MSSDQKVLSAIIKEWFRCNIATDDGGVCGIELASPLVQQKLFSDDVEEGKIPEIRPEDEMHFQVLQQITEYLQGRRFEFEIRVGVSFYDMQAAVYDFVCRIPYGQITTYEAIARKISLTVKPALVRSILVRNPLPLIIPCHRVVTGPISRDLMSVIQLSKNVYCSWKPCMPNKNQDSER